MKSLDRGFLAGKRPMAQLLTQFLVRGVVIAALISVVTIWLVAAATSSRYRSASLSRAQDFSQYLTDKLQEHFLELEAGRLSMPVCVELTQQLLGTVAKFDRVVKAVVVDSDRYIFASTEKDETGTPSGAEDIALAFEGRSRSEELSADGAHLFRTVRLIRIDAEIKYVFALTQSLREMDREISRQRRHLALVLSGGFLALFLALGFVVKRAGGRIEDLLNRELLAQVDRKKAQLEKANLEQLAAMKEELAGMLVHDLRNPLTSILGYTEILFEGLAGEVSEQQREHLASVYSSGQRLLDMINDILDVYKMEEKKLKIKTEQLRWQEIFSEEVQFISGLAQEKEVKIRQKIAPGLPQIEGDSGLIVRVIVNLLSNAITFSPIGGEVVLTACESAEGVRISVADRGEGIPEAYLGRIFDRFTQVECRKSGGRLGTGLGLTFCKLAVEAHGGKIWVESKLGEGSRFSFLLPKKQESTK